MNLISENLIVQTFFIFLTSVTLIGLFLPFTFRKLLTDKRVKQITSKEMEIHLRTEKENERIEKEASL